jgi:Protein RETICULATA-related
MDERIANAAVNLTAMSFAHPATAAFATPAVIGRLVLATGPARCAVRSAPVMVLRGSVPPRKPSGTSPPVTRQPLDGDRVCAEYPAIDGGAGGFTGLGGRNSGRSGGGGGGNGSSGAGGDASGLSAEVFAVLRAAGRNVDSLPGDVLQALRAGRVGADVLSAVLRAEAMPLLGTLARVWPALRNRLVANSRFPLTLGVELGVGICTKTLAEVGMRGDRFWKEFDFYTSDLALEIVGDAMLVWLLSPVALIAAGARSGTLTRKLLSNHVHSAGTLVGMFDVDRLALTNQTLFGYCVYRFLAAPAKARISRWHIFPDPAQHSVSV